MESVNIKSNKLEDSAKFEESQFDEEKVNHSV